MDDLLRQLGFSEIKYKDLTPIERETFFKKLDALKQSVLTIEQERDFIAHMRESVEQELTKPNLSHDEDLFLKARLRNLLLIESFLQGPVRAQKALERALKNVQ